VHRREVRRPVLRVEVGGEDAAGHAPAPQELARPARPSTTTAAATCTARRAAHHSPRKWAKLPPSPSLAYKG
jgi:hypothetical protein